MHVRGVGTKSHVCLQKFVTTLAKYMLHGEQVAGGACLCAVVLQSVCACHLRMCVCVCVCAEHFGTMCCLTHACEGLCHNTCKLWGMGQYTPCRVPKPQATSATIAASHA